jgi:hypothetical protein
MNPVAAVMVFLRNFLREPEEIIGSSFNSSFINGFLKNGLCKAGELAGKDRKQ